MGMIVMAHNGAVLMRIGPQRLSKRGQKFGTFQNKAKVVDSLPG
jgi:hypothetical protein